MKIPAVLHLPAILPLLALAGTLQAQQPLEPKPLRFDLTPFFGYRTSMSLPVEPHVTGTNPRVVLDAAPTFGVSFGARLTGREEDLVEVRWARQDSYLHSEDITPQLPRRRILLDQFHGDFSHEPWIEEWSPWIRPYVLGSIGATHVSIPSATGFTRFSLGLGGGIRFYASRHLGFKIQGEWLGTVTDPRVVLLCGGGCVVHLSATVASQGEAFVGTFLRF